jgi:hypothetical protein
VEVFDPSGHNIEHTGEAGELVCTRPHPSIPLYFWDDESGEKLRKAYFDTYPGEEIFENPLNVPLPIARALPGVWRQGDFMAVNPDTKGIILLGRRYLWISPLIQMWADTPFAVMASSIPVVYALVLRRYTPSLKDSLPLLMTPFVLVNAEHRTETSGSSFL